MNLLSIRNSKSVVLSASAVGCCFSAPAEVSINYPDWWTARGVINAEMADNSAHVTHGQLKWMVKNAYEEFAAQLPATSYSSNIQTVVNNFDYLDNWLPVNQGQLIAYAEPFYAWITNVVDGVTYTNDPSWYHAAWTNGIETRPLGDTTNDTALLYQGQLKNAFAFSDFGIHKYYYVATYGSDTNSGTSTNTPFKTIAHAVDVMTGGDTVFIRGGEYREGVNVVRNTKNATADRLTTIQNYANEIPVMKGSEIATNWTPFQDQIWMHTNWTPKCQQVFDDGLPLQQIGIISPKYMNSDEYIRIIGSGLEDMFPGSFFWDIASSNLYVWLSDSSNPSDSLMEVSKHANILFFNSNFVRIKGLHFRHSNSLTVYPTANGSAGVLVRNNSILEECDIQWCDTVLVHRKSDKTPFFLSGLTS